MRRVIFFIFVLSFWLLLTADFSSQEVIVGIGVAFLVAILFGGVILEPKKFFQPKRYFWFLIYLPLFLWECFKANIDVAYRVLHPQLPIKPGIVKVKTNLKTEIAQVFLANSITMTPGTLTVDIVDGFLYIHWINVRSKDIGKATKFIVVRFEKILARIFE